MLTLKTLLLSFISLTVAAQHLASAAPNRLSTNPPSPHSEDSQSATSKLNALSKAWAKIVGASPFSKRSTQPPTSALPQDHDEAAQDLDVLISRDFARPNRRLRARGVKQAGEKRGLDFGDEVKKLGDAVKHFGDALKGGSQDVGAAVKDAAKEDGGKEEGKEEEKVEEKKGDADEVQEVKGGEDAKDDVKSEVKDEVKKDVHKNIEGTLDGKPKPVQGGVVKRSEEGMDTDADYNKRRKMKRFEGRSGL